MYETFVTYSQAQALKRLGFDWSVYDGYARKIRLETKPSLGEPKFIHCKIQKNYNDSRKGLSERREYCSAPTQSMAAKWLREVKGMDIEVYPLLNYVKMTKSYNVHICYFGKDKNGDDCANYKMVDCNIQSYEQALSAGLDATLELLEKGG